MKSILRIVSLLLLVCMLIAPLGGCTYKNRPLIYLKSAVQRTVRQSLGGELLTVLMKSLSCGSVSLSVSGDDTLGGANALDAALYFDADRGKIMANTVLSSGEGRYDAQLWFSEDCAVLSSTAFLGSSTLGADFKTLKKDLEHSIFRNNSGTAYAVPEINESTAAAVSTWVEGFYSLYGSLDAMPRLFEEQLDTFLKCLTSYADYTHYTDHGKVKLYLAVDNSMLSRALRDTWASAVKDKAFCRRVREVAKTRDAMQSAVDGVVSTEWTNIVENWLKNNAELEALCAKIDAAAPFKLELTAHVKKLTGKLLYLDVVYACKDDASAFTLDISREEAFGISVVHKGVKHSLEAQVSENGWRRFAADLTYSRAEGEEAPVWKGTFSLDKRSDAFLLTYTKGDAVKEIGGSFAADSNGFSLAIDSVKTGEAQKNFKLAFSVAAKADIPDLPDHVDLPTISEQRLDPVATRAKEAYAAFKTEFDKTAITKESVLGYLLAPFALEE